MPLDVLKNRLITSPFVAGFVGAQAVAHGHADHVVSMAQLMRTQ